MEKYGVNELRKMFLDYFEQKNGHLKMKSFSLVPQNDNSVLIINAGIKEVVYGGDYAFLDTVEKMFKAAGVKHRKFGG